jgi:hypothetical protein
MQNQAQGVHQDVSLASTDLLGAIKTPDATRFRRFGTLTVDDPCGGLWITASSYANAFPQHIVDMLEHAAHAPLSILRVHRRPEREIQGKKSPSTAGLEHVQHGIH